jgi:hypothetical protein
MKLEEIINTAIEGKYIPYEEIKARKNQLLTYFREYYNSEPIILIWNVTNVGGASTISAEKDYFEAIQQILNNYYSDLNEEEREQEAELIGYNSIYLKTI